MKSFTLVIGIFLITCFTLLYNYQLGGADTPKCNNITMYPSYARINRFNSDYTRFASKYSLYLYREQGKDPHPSAENDYKLLGIPVLFIPGNAGSYRQVRSIASKLSTMIYDHEYHGENPNINNLDFFAADFNEDFTAFHGRIILDQAEFLNEAIRFILTLYNDEPDNPAPKSVMIMAHSMGGIVSRLMVTLPNYVPESINTILTLSSPHSKAPLTFDRDIMKIYRVINEFWKLGNSHPIDTGIQPFPSLGDPFSAISSIWRFFGISNNLQIAQEAHNRTKDISIISLTGGLLDNVLPADYTSIRNIVPPRNGFTVFTSGIELVWTSMDHLAIVWCDQLRNVVADVLFDIIDNSVPEKVYSLPRRMEIFKRNFMTFQPIELIGKETQFQKDRFTHYQGNVSILSTNKFEIIGCSEKCFDISWQISKVPNDYYGIKVDLPHVYVKSVKSNEMGDINYVQANIGVHQTINLSPNLLTTINLNVDNSLIAYKVTFDNTNIKTRQYNEIETKWHEGNFSLNYHGTSPFVVHNDPLKLDVWNIDRRPVKMTISVDFVISLKLLLIRYRTSIIAYGLNIALFVMLFQDKQSFTKTLDSLLTIKNSLIFAMGSLVFNLMINVPIGNKLLNLIYLEDEPLLGLGVSNFQILNIMFMILAITFNYIIAGLIEYVITFKPKLSLPSTPRKFKWFVGVVLMGLTLIYLPYQVIYIICVLVQMVKVIKTKDDNMVTLLMIMIWILPINVPIIVVLIHDFTINWKMSFSSHHNVLSILPIFTVVNGGYKFKINRWFVGYWIGYNWLYGSIHTFWLYQLFNYFCILGLILGQL